MSGFVYVLCSERNGRFYVGSTENLLRRYWRHASGQVKATARLRPWAMVGWRENPTTSEARRVERALKQQKSRLYIERWLAGNWEPVAVIGN